MAGQFGKALGGRRRRLGEVLVHQGVVTEAQVERGLAAQKLGGGRLGSILVRLKFCTDEAIRNALARQLEVQVVELTDFEHDPGVVGIVPRELIRKYELLPLKVCGDTLHIAMMDPYNLTAIDDVRFCTGMRNLVVVTCTQADFNAYLQEHLETQSLMDEILDGGPSEAAESLYRRVGASDTGAEAPPPELPSEGPIDELRTAGEQPPIVTLVGFLFAESVNRRASEVHVEAYESYLRVRARIDGRLQTILTPPRRLHSAMVARLKVLGGLDLATTRRPQDGLITVGHNEETVHFSVSMLPTVHGEKCVIRRLKTDQTLPSLDELGLAPAALDALRELIRNPLGLILVAGPRDSGKTTTLHAALADINDAESNIVTLEDPVQTIIPGVNQVQVDPASGMTFAAGLESVLRQSPDIVFLGEMADPSVASVAIKAALTGQLVLSTLPARGIVQALTHLSDLGVADHQLSESLLLLVSQRLLRKICGDCAQPHHPSAAELGELQLTEAQAARVLRGAGCTRCANTGYRGRTAVFELLVVSREVAELIRTGAPPARLIECARTEGMVSMREAGVAKVLSGLTTLDELRRVLSDTR